MFLLPNTLSDVPCTFQTFYFTLQLLTKIDLSNRMSSLRKCKVGTFSKAAEMKPKVEVEINQETINLKSRLAKAKLGRLAKANWLAPRLANAKLGRLAKAKLGRLANAKLALLSAADSESSTDASQWAWKTQRHYHELPT